MMSHYRIWYNQFIAPWKASGEEVYAVKIAHIQSVVNITRHIVRLRGLSESQMQPALLAAQFHDLGRFPQYEQYQTFNDGDSLDHAALSVDILRQQHVLKGLPESVQSVIYSAISEHSRMSVCGNYDADTLFYIHLLRDADKISNFPFFIKNYVNFRVKRSGEINRTMLLNLIEGRLLSNQKLQTMEEVQLYHLSWMNDININESRQYILEKKFINKLVGLLPPSVEISELSHALTSRLQRNLNS